MFSSAALFGRLVGLCLLMATLRWRHRRPICSERHSFRAESPVGGSGTILDASTTSWTRTSTPTTRTTTSPAVKIFGSPRTSASRPPRTPSLAALVGEVPLHVFADLLKEKSTTLPPPPPRPPLTAAEERRVVYYLGDELGKATHQHPVVVRYSTKTSVNARQGWEFPLTADQWVTYFVGLPHQSIRSIYGEPFRKLLKKIFGTGENGYKDKLFLQSFGDVVPVRERRLVNPRACWDGNGPIRIFPNVFQKVSKRVRTMTMVVVSLHTQCLDECGDFGKIWEVSGKHSGGVLWTCFDPRLAPTATVSRRAGFWGSRRKPGITTTRPIAK